MENIFSRKNVILISKNVIKFLVFTALFCWISFLYIQSLPAMGDDTYIHIRIAENLASNGVPYYNLTESVKSDSSSVYLLLLAGMFKLFPGGLYLIPIVNTLFILGGGSVFVLILQQQNLLLHRSGNILKGSFIVVYILLMQNLYTEYMEAPLAMFLVALFLYYFIQKKELGFLFLGIGVFARFELWIVFGIFFVLVLFQNKNRYWLSIFYFVLGMLPFLMFDIIFFQTIIPNAFIAKKIVYISTYDQILRSILSSLYPRSWNVAVKFILLFVTVLVIVWSLLVRKYKSESLSNLVNRIRERLSDPEQAIFAYFVSGMVICTSYFLFRGLLFQWYIPLYLIPLAFTIYYLASKRSYFFLIILIPILLTPMQLMVSRSQDAISNNPPYPYDDYSARVRKYISVGENLYQFYPDMTLLTSEIGGLGYGYKGYILDGVGLVSPQVLKYHPLDVPKERSSGRIGAIPPEVIRDYSPEIIVSYPAFIEAFLKSELVNDYIQISEDPFLPEDIQKSQTKMMWGSSELLIFIRKDIYTSQ